jgi:hypothetical protein
VCLGDRANVQCCTQEETNWQLHAAPDLNQPDVYFLTELYLIAVEDLNKS